METLKIKLNNDHSVGLGDNLCLLSALANIRPPVELYVNNEHNTFDRLTQYKRIFRIPNSQLTIHPSDENGNFNNVGWPVKFFSEYYRPSYVSTHGRTHPLNINRNDRQCIAIACSFDIDKEQSDKWPWCRARPASYWGRVFAWVKQMGYDVITVDQAHHNLEDKIELMAKHCRAIISYEGGMAHLAHMLNLPCFLVNWRLPSPSTQLGGFHCEFVHKSKSVYILRDDEELMSWSSNEFSTRIFALEQGQTNNRLVNGDCKVKFDGPGVRGKITVTAASTGQIMLQTDPIFGDNAVAELLSKYY